MRLLLYSLYTVSVFSLIGCFPNVTLAKQILDKKTGRVKLEQHGLRIRVVPRGSDHMAAFYEGRGLPHRAIKHLKDVCFFTVSVHQLEKRIVWIEPARFRFTDAKGKVIKRYPREYWDQLWNKLGVPSGARATFGWVQLPTARDLRYQEPIGGMIMVAPTKGKIKLTMEFPTGANKNGPSIRIRLHSLQCRFSEERK